MSHSHSSTHSGGAETIDQVLHIKFPRIHSSEETLASMTSRNFGPPLSPTFVGPGSKRSRQQTTAAEEDQSEHPLYQDLASNYWQGPMPGHFIMHLQDHVRLKAVQSFDNLPLLLVQYIQTLPGRNLTIPDNHQYASHKRRNALFDWEKPSTTVETIPDLQDAHIYQGKLIAACASALAGNSARFADSTGFLQSAENAPTIHPGSEEVHAAEYLVLNPTLPGVRASTKQAHQIRYEAIEHFGLSAIQVTHIQAICAPLNANFPLSAVVQFAQEQLPLESFICQGWDDSAHCRSDHCCGRVLDFPMPFTTSGRPIGVDGDLALSLISQAKVTRLPARKPLTRAERITVSLFLENVWGVALAADATFITVSGVNEDMMFIRHRASQTLFLSNALTVHRDPLSTKTPHLAVHVGEAVCAHDDALSRASKLEVRRREGTLPASFRYPFQNDIDLLKSDLTFNELSRSYELSIGKFLPPNLFRSEYSYESNKDLFNRATELRIHWDDDDASMLHFIFDDFKSPMTLSAVTATAMNSSTASVLDVKIHCFKQHSRRVFLCHFIDTNKRPYGRPLVMKLAWSPILEEYEEVIEFSRVVETPEIDHEFEMLERLADGDPDVACRVPKPYGHFSGDVKIIEQPYKFSAYFVEDCAGCYPIGIADEIDADLCITVPNWLKAVHTPLGGHLLHNNLSRENILFKPSDPTCFYVVGWQKASTMEATGEEECVEWEEELLQDLLAVKKHHVYEKRARHDLEGEYKDEGSQIEPFSNEYEDA